MLGKSSVSPRSMHDGDLIRSFEACLPASDFPQIPAIARVSHGCFRPRAVIANNSTQ